METGGGGGTSRSLASGVTLAEPGPKDVVVLTVRRQRERVTGCKSHRSVCLIPAGSLQERKALRPSLASC